DVPLGRPGGAAPRFPQPDPDDDALGGPVPDALRRGRHADRLARGRIAPAGVVAGADGGAPAAGRMGQVVRLLTGAALRGGSVRTVPADVGGRRAGRG